MIVLNSFCQVVVVWDIDAFEKIQRDLLKCLQILCTKNESRKREEGIKYFFLDLVLVKLNLEIYQIQVITMNCCKRFILLEFFEYIFLK